MNILPKKRWHVRTKENIARVRRDEAEAAEKERQEKLRIEQADRELRLSILKQKSKKHLESLSISTTKDEQPGETKLQHINFFDDIEHAVSTKNKEHEKEVKEKNEEYEKKIGYLTYLGQDTNEALGKKNWYEIAPGSSRFSRPSYVKDTYDKLVLKDEDGKPKEKHPDEKDGEIEWKLKQRHDPINSFKHLSKKSKLRDTSDSPKDLKIKSKPENPIEQKLKTKHKISEKDMKLQKLREARLKREQQEKYRTELFLTKLTGKQVPEESPKIPKIVPKYNSQFNPELARQNYR